MFVLLKCVLFVGITFLVAAGALDEFESCKNNDFCPRNEVGVRRQNLGEGPRSLIEIQEHNWTKLLIGEWILNICAKNSEDCRKMELNGYKLAISSVHSRLNVGIAVADLAAESTLSRRLWISELPTVYHIIDGQFRRLDAQMDVQALRRLVEWREWKSIRKIAFWKHPTSIWSCLSVFAHKITVDLWKSGAVGEDYNLASWCINLMFANILIMIVWIVYFCWRITNFTLYCLARVREMSNEQQQEQGHADDANASHTNNKSNLAK